MAHNHEIYDSGSYFTIDPQTRMMRTASGIRPRIVQNDHNSERFTFSLPRLIEGHDMLTCDRVEVHYLNIEAGTGEKSEGFCTVDDLRNDPKDQTGLLCSWLISRNATKYVGTLSFLLRFVCVSAEDTEYVWQTAIYTGILVFEGFDFTQSEIEKYPDVLSGWETRIAALEKLASDMLYQPIEITSFTNGIGTAEIGSTVKGVTFSWAFNKIPTTLTLDGEEMRTDFIGCVKSDLNMTANTTFTLEATDERGATATKTTSVTFQNGVYYGISEVSEAVDSALVLTLTKELRSNKKPSFSVNAGIGQYIYYCVPKRFGTCTFTVGGFTGGFTLVDTISFTNSSGYTEDYYVYRSDNASLGETAVTVG